MYYASYSKPNIPLRVSCVLLVLVVISIYMMSGLYARYVTSSEGSDGAQIAHFGELKIMEGGTLASASETKTVIPGVNLEENAAVEIGTSEVAVYVFLKVEADGWTESNGSYSHSSGKLSWSIDSDNWTRLEANVFYIKVDASAATHTVNILADNLITVADTLTASEMTSLPSINFRAFSIQIGEFSSAAEAWDSLKNKL